MNFVERFLVRGSFWTLLIFSWITMPQAHARPTTAMPTGLTATAVSSSQINLKWTDKSTNETGFTVMIGTDSSFSTANYILAGGAGTTSFSHTGLIPEKTYFYKVKANGSSTDSSYTSSVNATTKIAAPSGLTATAVSSSRIDLKWTDSSSKETGYTVAVSPTTSLSSAVYSSAGGSGTTTFSHTGLNAETIYYFWVKAEGSSDAMDSVLSVMVKSATLAAVSPSPTPSSSSSPTPSPSTVPVSGQAISPFVFGQNAWMPNQIGARVYSGKLEQKWTQIKDAGVRIMRHGGIGVDENYCGPEVCYKTASDVTTSATYNNDPTSLTNNSLNQYIKMVDDMRLNGIEPILEVPYFKGKATATIAANLVRHVNITKGRNVKYWTIGNEPNLGYSYITSSAVGAYIKPFAKAMKAVDPTIKIIGPDPAWYDTRVINGLTTCPGTDDITGKDANGNYYIDIIAFHTYPSNPTATRSDVIGLLTKPGGFNDNLTALKARLAACDSYHGRTGASALKMGVTEANLDYRMASYPGFDGQGTSSFLGGQFWAELLGIAMKKGVEMVNFWGVIEGDNIGYFNSSGIKYSNYHHFQMLAQNFKGVYLDGIDKVNGVASPNIKSFGSNDGTQIAVLIMNQEQSTDHNFTLRLDGGTVTGTNPLKINVNAGVAREYPGFIPNESSLLLVFDSAGNLKKKISYQRTSTDAALNAVPVTTTY